jgi:hypothetical protein
MQKINTETFTKNPSVASRMKTVILSVAIARELQANWRACAAKYERATLGSVKKFCKELQTFSDEALDKAIHSLTLEL